MYPTIPHIIGKDKGLKMRKPRPVSRGFSEFV
jgi:hypothetical protein